MEIKYISHSGSDLTVVNAARVSFNKKSDWSHENSIGKPVGAGYDLVLKEDDKKLIKYLADHDHTSPFNHCFITMHIKAPIFVARQLQKHEYMPWNEISRRYVTDEPEFFEPTWREKAENVKQGSGEPFGEKDQFWFNSASHYNKELVTFYKWLLDEGVAPEQARMVLPQSLYTEWYWSGTLGAWAKMYKLRSDNHTQMESQFVALTCGAIIGDLFPVSWSELVK